MRTTERFGVAPERIMKSPKPTSTEKAILYSIFAEIKDRSGKGWRKAVPLSLDYIQQLSSASRDSVVDTKYKLHRAGIFDFQKQYDNKDVFIYKNIPEDWDKEWDQPTPRDLKKQQRTKLESQRDQVGKQTPCKLEHQPEQVGKASSSSEDYKKRTEDQIVLSEDFVNLDPSGFASSATLAQGPKSPESNGNHSHQEQDEEIDTFALYDTRLEFEPEPYDDSPDQSIFVDEITPQLYLPCLKVYEKMLLEFYGARQSITPAWCDLLKDGNRFNLKHFQGPLRDETFMRCMFEFIRTPISGWRIHEWETRQRVTIGVVWQRDVVDRMSRVVWWAHGKGHPKYKTILADQKESRLAELARLVSMKLAK